MRAFLMVCFTALAAAQYNYGPTINNGEDISLLAQSPQTVGEEYNKSFYSYSAPEQDFEDINAAEQIASIMKKNIRVIFIKGPNNKGLEEAAIQLAKTAADDRTAIYVLNKQTDIGSWANQLQQLKSTSDNKPKVHFVKYRTQADAESAQRTIQAQYNSLPGATTNNAPSEASVLDFASKTVSSSAGSSATAGPSIASTPAPPSRTYIPPKVTYKRF